MTLQHQKHQKFNFLGLSLFLGLFLVIGSLLAIASNFSGGPLPVDYVVSPRYIRNETFPLEVVQDYPTSCDKLSQFHLPLPAKVLSVWLYKNKTMVYIRQPSQEKEYHRVSFSVYECKELMRIFFDIAWPKFAKQEVIHYT